MDREPFDAIARLVWTRQSRRAALASVLGAALLGHSLAGIGAGLLAKRKGTKKRKMRHKHRGPAAAMRLTYSLPDSRMPSPSIPTRAGGLFAP